MTLTSPHDILGVLFFAFVFGFGFAAGSWLFTVILNAISGALSRKQQ